MAKMIVRRVGVLSWAKIQGLVMAAVGLIIGILYGLMLMLFGAAMMAATGGRAETAGAAVGGVIGGLAVMVIAPIFYGLLGFVFGALGAVIYNFAAGFIGGVELELEGASAEYVSPPPPQWSAEPRGDGPPPRY
ncbi:MAG TPA: hypothetical protein VER08_03265 [Pyrinomonadaceae bacterium]|nr:hypothetical protein [Pyrinomonadaceae bacterium]